MGYRFGVRHIDMAIYYIGMVILGIDMENALMIWEMTVSIWSSLVLYAPGRVQSNTNMRSIGKNTNPAAIKFGGKLTDGGAATQHNTRLKPFRHDTTQRSLETFPAPLEPSAVVTPGTTGSHQSCVLSYRPKSVLPPKLSVFIPPESYPTPSGTLNPNSALLFFPVLWPCPPATGATATASPRPSISKRSEQWEPLSPSV